MSVETLAMVLHHSRATGTDKLVLLGIANHDGDGGAWPSIATLAKYANVQPRAVQRSIRRLQNMREVHVYLNAGGTLSTPDEQRPNRYDVLVTCPPTCDRTKNHRVAPLPEAPADLWINPLSPTTPPVAHDRGGVSPTTGGGVSPTTPEPSYEPSTNQPDHSPALTTGRACAICSQPEDECRRRARTNGHRFTTRDELAG